jgi:hypothetical protein
MKRQQSAIGRSIASHDRGTLTCMQYRFQTRISKASLRLSLFAPHSPVQLIPHWHHRDPSPVGEASASALGRNNHDHVKPSLRTQTPKPMPRHALRHGQATPSRAHAFPCNWQAIIEEQAAKGGLHPHAEASYAHEAKSKMRSSSVAPPKKDWPAPARLSVHGSRLHVLLGLPVKQFCMSR